MKKLFAVLATLVTLSLLSCASGGASASGGTAASAAQPAPKPYIGDGGNGVSITILPPRGAGLATEQNYLPDLVANELVSNFRSYSAMTLFDRVNNQKQYDELLSGIYSDDDKAGLDLGHLSSTEYMLLGDITKTTTGYALHLMVNRNSDKTTAAAYSGTCTVAELDNLTGVRRASLELLGKMGVQLTVEAKSELSGAARNNAVNAQTALARGIVAQRSGNTVETMAQFYAATAYDPSFAEAAARANAMSTTIRTGSLGENIRNDIAWRDEWVKIINDAKEYIRKQRPVLAQVIYDPALKQDKINYDKRTVDFILSMDVKAVPYPPAYIKMVNDLNAGLSATGRNGDWRIYELSLKDIWTSADYGKIFFNAELVDSAGKIIAQNQEECVFSFGGSKIRLIYDPYHFNRNYFNTGETLQRQISPTATFTVKADDVTDQMTVRLRAYASYYYGSMVFPVEVIDIETAGRIDAERLAQLPISGLPQMATEEMYIRYGAEKYIKITVEIPDTPNENKYLLSYRPSFPDGHGVLILGRPEYIDTSNYRFPVSMAFLVTWDNTYILWDITNTVKPNSRERVPKQKFGNDVAGVLIVPDGWFKRNSIKEGAARLQPER